MVRDDHGLPAVVELAGVVVELPSRSSTVVPMLEFVVVAVRIATLKESLCRVSVRRGKRLLHPTNLHSARDTYVMMRSND